MITGFGPPIEFNGSVDIELKSGEICYDRDVTLVARVSGADMDYRLVWEANDGSGCFLCLGGRYEIQNRQEGPAL